MTVQCKIDCCFADNVYRKYQNKKYGINYCLKPEEDDIESLLNLKKIYDYHLLTNTLEDSECDINKIIEKINRI